MIVVKGLWLNLEQTTEEEEEVIKKLSMGLWV